MVLDQPFHEDAPTSFTFTHEYNLAPSSDSFINTVSPTQVRRSESDDLSSLESSPPIEYRRSPSDRLRLSPEGHCQRAIAILREGRLGPDDLMLHVLRVDNAEGHRSRSAIYKKGGKLGQILSAIMDSREGKECFEDWIRDCGVDVFGEIISDEMDVVKTSFSMRTTDITPTFIENWSIESSVGTIAKRDAPVLTHLLLHAAQTPLARTKNKVKKPDILCHILVAQLANSRSSHSLSFQAIFSLFLWTTGCQRQTIDALFRCGLTVSFDSLLNIVSNLSDHCIRLAEDCCRKALDCSRSLKQKSYNVESTICRSESRLSEPLSMLDNPSCVNCLQFIDK